MVAESRERTFASCHSGVARAGVTAAAEIDEDLWPRGLSRLRGRTSAFQPRARFQGQRTQSSEQPRRLATKQGEKALTSTSTQSPTRVSQDQY